MTSLLARLPHDHRRSIITSAESRERRGQADGKDRSRLDAAAASWRPPRARAGCRDCGSDGNSSDRSPRSPRTSGDDASTDSCNGQLPYHCTPDRFEGWNPSKFRTCSIVISARTLSKSTPGTVVPHSLRAVVEDVRSTLMGKCSARTVPFPLHTLYGERERPPQSISPGVANPRACGRAGRLAPATPAPRPSARS